MNDLKNNAIMINSYELFSSLCVIVIFGLVKAYLEINPLFHFPVDPEARKLNNFIFTRIGP